jgi:hypothetical protein
VAPPVVGAPCPWFAKTIVFLNLRFGGFYRHAKILERIAAGIASGEIQVPK